MRHRRSIIAAAASLVLLAPPGVLWQRSLLPDHLSAAGMGRADYGGGPAAAGHQHAGHTGSVSVTSLTGPVDRPADVVVELVARRQRFDLPGAGSFDGYTLNGTSPGPRITARQGDLVQVTLVNESVPDGVTLHWHGVDVPNAEDGVAGVTQDAVPPGRSHVYRFVAEDAGTYWYHSHQLSHEQVRGGLLGALVVLPSGARPAVVDEVALVHTYGKRRTVNGRYGEYRIAAPAGATVRVRLVNSDNGALRTWATGAPYTLVAVDGHDVSGPTPVRDATVLVTAGGRADLRITLPADGSAVRIGLGGGATSVVVGPPASAATPDAAEPAAALDLLSYGTPAAIGFDPGGAVRRFQYRIGRRPGFLDGRPGLWWTINGHMYPDVPMFMVSEGDVVTMRIENGSGAAHPMHLHGHHLVVLSRNGILATGSPWWVDSLEVEDGATYEVAFVADNPGLWMDHCHNLPHAAQGLIAHLMYQNVTTPTT